MVPGTKFYFIFFFFGLSRPVLARNEPKMIYIYIYIYIFFFLSFFTLFWVMLQSESGINGTRTKFVFLFFGLSWPEMNQNDVF